MQTRAPQQASFFWPRSMTPGRKQGLGLSREPSRGTWRHATANQQNRCLGTTATQRKPTPTHATVIAVSSGSFLPIPYHCIRANRGQLGSSLSSLPQLISLAHVSIYKFALIVRGSNLPKYLAVPFKSPFPNAIVLQTPGDNWTMQFGNHCRMKAEEGPRVTAQLFGTGVGPDFDPGLRA